MVWYFLEGRGGTLRNFGWGCAAGTLELLAFTRPSSSDFRYPILGLTPQIPPYPRVAVFQKLLRSSQNKTNLIFFIFLGGNSRFP